MTNDFNKLKRTMDDFDRPPKYRAEKYYVFRNQYADEATKKIIDDEIYQMLLDNSDPLDESFYLDLLPDEYVAMYKKANEAEVLDDPDISNIKIVSGNSFEGFKIVNYSEYIAGDGVTYLRRDVFTQDKDRSGGDAFSRYSDTVSDSLTKIRENALNKLKKAAFGLGCNAVVGVAYSYTTSNVNMYYRYSNAYDEEAAACTMITVTVSGTAVQIEKE